MIRHGGNLRWASHHYGIALNQWMDLSTGINPNGYLPRDIPEDIWRRLPENDDGLEEAARNFYGTTNCLPIAGTQSAIQLLPKVLAGRTVIIQRSTYAEHAYRWQRAGRTVELVDAINIKDAAGRADIVVVCNPNNPTGSRMRPDALLTLRDALATRGGWLIIDEAFADCDASDSLAYTAGVPGLVILRSIGKFFGLAGIRAGFLLGPRELLEKIEEEQGPWAVSGPARCATTTALRDTPWQKQARHRLHENSGRLRDMLCAYGLPPAGGTPLFQWLPHPRARALHEALARQAIWVRLFDDTPSLRFGLPKNEAEWQRLEAALQVTIMKDRAS